MVGLRCGAFHSSNPGGAAPKYANWVARIAPELRYAITIEVTGGILKRQIPCITFRLLRLEHEPYRGIPKTPIKTCRIRPFLHVRSGLGEQFFVGFGHMRAFQLMRFGTRRTHSTR